VREIREKLERERESEGGDRMRVAIYVVDGMKVVGEMEAESSDGVRLRRNSPTERDD
jgi:hypothetical protein